MKGETQSQLSKLLKVSRSAISFIENDKINPSEDGVKVLTEHYDVDENFFYIDHYNFLNENYELLQSEYFKYGDYDKIKELASEMKMSDSLNIAKALGHTRDQQLLKTSFKDEVYKRFPDERADYLIETMEGVVKEMEGQEQVIKNERTLIWEQAGRGGLYTDEERAQYKEEIEGMKRYIAGVERILATSNEEAERANEEEARIREEEFNTRHNH